MSRYVFLTAACEVELPSDFDGATPQQLAAIGLGVEVQWSGFPEGSSIRVAGPRVHGGLRLNGSNPTAGWQT